MPGAFALFEEAGKDGNHSVLDLGPGSDENLRVYGRIARRVRFADFLPAVTSGAGWPAALDTVPFQPEQPYDLVFAWNVLDWLDADQRRGLVARLAERSARNAHLHLVVEASEGVPRPLDFTLVDAGRVRCEPAPETGGTRSPLLPAEVERLIAPFQVVRGFTLKTGLREYVAVRKEAED